MNPGQFPPPKRRGMAIHAGLLTVLVLVSIWGFSNVSQASVGPVFVAYLLAALLAFLPVPILSYRIYSLSLANYQLGRDHLLIQWGLRVEDIPLSDLEWVRPISDLAKPLALPWFSLPGGILGLSRHPDLGLVEFIAAESKDMLLVATARRVFAISPDQAVVFVQAFARSVELGSLSPVEARSVYPSFVIARAWESPLARFFWLGTLFMNFSLFVWVSFLIPSLASISLTTQPGRLAPPEAMPSTQLILLPLISTLLATIDWLAGLYFYRWEKERPLAFVVWGSGLLGSLAFLAAVFFIISTPA